MKPSRREFVKVIGACVTASAVPKCLHAAGLPSQRKRHILTLSFDDGLKKSCLKTAEIYEKYGFSACLNIIATGHLKTFKPDQGQAGFPRGDFGLWNELKGRGHEIHPHGYKHAALGQLPLGEAKDLVLRCLDMFSKELKGFDPRKAVFAFPYGSTNPELSVWLATKVRAFRTGRGINPLPHKGQVKLGSGLARSTGSMEERIDRTVDELLSTDSGWQVITLHGLDGEGWKPIRSDYLDGLLKRLSMVESLDILPPIRAFAKYTRSD